MENNFNKNNHENRENRENKGELLKKNNKEYGIFDPFFDGFFRFPSFKNEMKEMEKLMKTDVRESENGYDIEVEMPGYEKGDINLELNNGYLTITASRNEKNDESDKKDNYIRRERYYGNCARSFYVGDIKEEDIDAKLEKGVLSIHIPKEVEKDSKKKIEIK